MLIIMVERVKTEEEENEPKSKMRIGYEGGGSREGGMKGKLSL